MTRYQLDEHRAAMGRRAKDPDRCRCVPLNPKHLDPWHCLTRADVAAFVAANPGAKPRAHLAWLWLTFDRDAPYAQR